MSTFSQITAEQTPARRDGERLFLSRCLHYSCQELHAGQWISRKPEKAAVDKEERPGHRFISEKMNPAALG